MMEIQEDKLQQRILKLRKKQNNGGRNNSIGAYSGGGDQSQMEPSSPTFLSPLTCTRNSRRYLYSDKRGNLYDDDEENLLNSMPFQMTGMPRGEHLSPEQRKAIQSQMTDFSATPGKKAGATGDNSNLQTDRTAAAAGAQSKSGNHLNLVSSKTSVNSRNALGGSATAYAGETIGKQSASRMRGRATSGIDSDTLPSLHAQSAAYDPIGLASTGKLPEIADAFRSTGNVCVERTIRILNKSRPQGYEYTNSPDELVAHVRRMGRTFTKTKRSTDGANVGYAS